MDVEQEIQRIEQRNKRVETDKAWELSWTRRLFITAITYAAAVLWLYLIAEGFCAGRRLCFVHADYPYTQKLVD